MSSIKKGQSKMVARARLMILLGEQLITDEVAAVSELVKNAYDADATEVNLILSNLSEPEIGYIIIRDNGHGMSRDEVLTSWLELGTISKARESDKKPRYSERLKRVYLGEKGLGRLSVHKLGFQTELITRRIDSDVETRLFIDWTDFEKNEGFLDDVPVEWEVRKPMVFTGQTKRGTQIRISQLRRKWKAKMIEDVQRSILAIKSPFSELSDFKIEIDIDDELAPKEVTEWIDLIETATYQLIGTVDNSGIIKYEYKFFRQDLPDLGREKRGSSDIRDPEQFSGDRKPISGPFSFRFYAWDLLAADKRAVFGDSSIYNEVIYPNSGIRVFRDSFRVLPYGNTNDDWLGMDRARVRLFERHLSRNQVIGAIEINSANNPYLIDKTDREGLIDNDQFRDFRSLVIGAISVLENERFIDRRNLKEVLGRTRKARTDRALFSRNLTEAMKAIQDLKELNDYTKHQIQKMISDARAALDNLLTQKEQPLLVAATIGLTYMMPTHEVLRPIHEALKILRQIRKSEKNNETREKISSIISNLRKADELVRGISKLMQKTTMENFNLRKVAEEAMDLMRFKFERSSIKYEIKGPSSIKVSGDQKLLVHLLLNFLDNSFYWLLREKPENRKIKILLKDLENESALIVSDSGPGFEDEINTVTLPFFTRKPKGIGLGLYIADRIAKMNNAKLRLLTNEDFNDLLSGASIGVFLPKVER